MQVRRVFTSAELFGLEPTIQVICRGLFIEYRILGLYIQALGDNFNSGVKQLAKNVVAILI